MNVPEIGFWDGIMDVARGRGQLRLIVQPLVAILIGARLGISDAKEGQAPFVLRLFTVSLHRAQLLKGALHDVMIPFSIAVVLDGVLQYISLGYVRPLAAIVMGIALIWLPFSIARAFANRIHRSTHRDRTAENPA